MYRILKVKKVKDDPIEFSLYSLITRRLANLGTFGKQRPLSLGLRFIVPGIAFESPVLTSLAPFSPQFAWIAVIFLLPAVESVIKSSRKPKRSNRQSRTKAFRQFSAPALTSRAGPFYSPISTQHERAEERDPIDLSAQTLKKLEWYSFELFCKIYYEALGFSVVKTKAGADKGVDLLLYKNDAEETPYALVQCKVRTHKDIGVNYVRELLGVMTAEKIQKGILVTNSCFTEDAKKFAKDRPIEIVDIYRLTALISELESEKSSKLVKFLESNDYTTPTCPTCETKLVERITKRGKYVGRRFWGCRNYPRCTYTLNI